MLAKLGVETEYYDPLLGGKIEKLVRKNTRLIFTESPGSQTFEVQDIPAIAAVAKAENLWLLMDNTWASPLYFRPFAHGVDVSIQAATKYIVGHADAMLGAITSNARAAKYVERSCGHLGACPGSEETFLGLRGLRTLDVRLERHQDPASRSRAGCRDDPRSHACCTRPARRSRSRPLEARFFRRVRAFLGDPEAGLQKGGRGHARWARSSSAWAIPGAATKASSSHSIQLVPHGHKWNAEGPALRFHIGLEDVDDLKRDLQAAAR